jgi:hypothetical protein
MTEEAAVGDNAEADPAASQLAVQRDSPLRRSIARVIRERMQASRPLLVFFRRSSMLWTLKC